MRQVIRLMDNPDRMIAFDELPADLLEGLEMWNCHKLSKEWRDFIGYRDKVTKIPADLHPLTGQMRTYDPIVEKAPYAFLIDRELNHDKERWGEIESFVRRNAPKDFRLMDRLSDMAKPLARDVHSEVSLEVEDCIVIPIVKEGAIAVPAAPIQPPVQAPAAPPPPPPVASTPPSDAPYEGPLKITPITTTSKEEMLRCVACDKIFSSRQALRMHTTKKHSEAKTAA